jgi:hypothetical protein
LIEARPWWTRRRVLRVGARLLAVGAATALGPVTSVPAAEDEAKAGGAGARDADSDQRTVTLLREVVQRRALQSTEPWLMAHVVLALGADAKDGKRSLVDAMVADSLELVTIDGKTYPRFSLEVERHPFHFLQILQAVDVPYDHRFVTPRGSFTRREIVHGSEAVFDPKSHLDEYSWTISVLAHEFPPDRDRFENARGQEVVVSSLVAEHLRDTETAYAATFASMNEGKPFGRGLIHTKACNGAHLIYGLIDALRYGYRRDDLPAKFDRLARATIFRLQLEQKLVDATLRGNDPMVRLNADAVKLSFLGHVLEDLGYARSCGVLTFDPAQLAAIAVARRQLGGVVERLTSEHDLDLLRANVPNAYILVLGDACHALRGMGYWT